MTTTALLVLVRTFVLRLVFMAAVWDGMYKQLYCDIFS